MSERPATDHIAARTLGSIPRTTDKPVKRRTEPAFCTRCARPLNPYNLDTTCAPCDHTAREQNRRPW